VARAPTDYHYFDPMSVGVSTKPRHATKPSKIRDVNFIVAAPVHTAAFSRPVATKALCYTVNL